MGKKRETKHMQLAKSREVTTGMRTAKFNCTNHGEWLSVTVGEEGEEGCNRR